MFNAGALINVVNRRIGSKLHQVRLIISILICMTAHLTIGFQVYTMEEEKRGLCPFDDKRYLFADLLDGRPNPNTHAYGHRDLAAEKHLVADQPEPGPELIIRHPEERFARRHARVTRRLELAGEINIQEELPDGDADVELHVDKLLWLSKWLPRDLVAPFEWVTGSNESLPATISSGLSRRLVECQRHLRSNVPGRVD